MFSEVFLLRHRCDWPMPLSVHSVDKRLAICLLCELVLGPKCKRYNPLPTSCLQCNRRRRCTASFLDQSLHCVFTGCRTRLAGAYSCPASEVLARSPCARMCVPQRVAKARTATKETSLRLQPCGGVDGGSKSVLIACKLRRSHSKIAAVCLPYPSIESRTPPYNSERTLKDGTAL